MRKPGTWTTYLERFLAACLCALAVCACSNDATSETGGGGDGGSGGVAADLEWPPTAVVYLDAYGVPNADCETDEDCAMVLGYFHARDRFVQMDLQRRLSTGQLSQVVNRPLVEAVGLLELLIETAAANRALYSTRDGRPAELVALDNMDDKTMGLYQAYTAGVNQWLDEVRNGENGATWPAEFNSPLLDYEPADAPDWRVEDSLATVLTLVGSLTNDESTQVRAAVARQAIDDNLRFQDLWSLEPLHKTSILEPDAFPSPSARAEPKGRDRPRPPIERRARSALAALSARLARTEQLAQLFPEIVGAPRDVGSNNWALGPTKTQSGRAFFSADSHLGLSQPSTFYVAHLDAKTAARGPSILPGIRLPGCRMFCSGKTSTSRGGRPIPAWISATSTWKSWSKTTKATRSASCFAARSWSSSTSISISRLPTARRSRA